MWPPRRILVLIAAGLLAACNAPGVTTIPLNQPNLSKANPSGDGQTGTAGTPLPEPLRVQVAHNTVGVNGIFIEWRVTSGGGSVAPTQSVTNANGVATTVLTLGPSAGTNTVEASSSGVVGSPVTFTATAVVTGSPATTDRGSGPPH